MIKKTENKSYYPSGNPEYNKITGLALVLMSLFFLSFQFWKPNFWWNSPRANMTRSIFGDSGADALGYGLSLIPLFVGILAILNSRTQSSSSKGDNDSIQ